MKNRVVILAAALCLSSAVAVAQDQLSTARDLIRNNDARAAYRLLSQDAAQRAGDPDFDKLLGISALLANEPMRATMALERVLVVRPGDHEAREFLAQAYARLGETDAARAAVADLQRSAPSTEARARFDRLAGFVESAAAGAETSITGHVEFALGHDSNVNSATGSGVVAVPGLGGALATLTAAGVQQSDKFFSLSGGVNLQHRLTPSWSILGSVAASMRNNFERGAFDNATLDAGVAAAYKLGIDQYIFGLQQATFVFDDNRLRDYSGVSAQWRRAWSRDTESLAFLQHGRQTYPGQDLRNTDRTVIGGSLVQALPAGQNTVVFATAYLGREDELAGNAPHLGHELAGARIGGETTIHPRAALYGLASFEDRRYGGLEPLFNTGRHDRQYDMTVGLRYQLDRRLSLSPQLSHQYNDSNVQIYRYRRSILQAALRYQF